MVKLKRLFGTVAFWSLIAAGASFAQKIPDVPLPSAAVIPTAITPAQFWTTAFGTSPRLPMAGDANGDGRADLLSVWPQGEGVIDSTLTSYFGKPVAGNQARTQFGKNGIAAACGFFARLKAADILMVCADGNLRVASDMSVGSRTYSKDDVAGFVPLSLLPKAPTRTVVADFDADDKSDVLIIGSDGKLLLLLNRRTADGLPRMIPVPVETSIKNALQISAGQFAEGSPAQVVWLDKEGCLLRAALKISGESAALVPPQTLLTPVDTAAKLVVGHFCGAKNADILLGQQLIPGGEVAAKQTLPNLPTITEAEGDASWIAADFDGNGRDDLLRLRRTKERFSGEDTLIHFFYNPEGGDKGYYSTSNDGLPDVWKTGKIKLGQLDLAALGCRVGRKDIIIELERFDDVSLENLRTNMQRVSDFYANLPVKNPDGSTGISLHFIYKKPIPLRDHDQVMREFDARFPPMEHRGVVHTMFAENNGPLVSKNNGDNGHFNGGAAEFLHEFGHQLDLSHEGFHQSAFCAAYPSLMNYSYSYHVNGREDIRYSDGILANIPLSELHLSEVLSVPLAKVNYLSSPPYNFPLRAAPDGVSTYVDWNLNGIWGETDTQADINYSHGVSIGPRYDKGRTQSAPAVVTLGKGAKERLFMLYGVASVGESGLSPSTPGRLALRLWQGADRDKDAQNWSEETTVAASGVTGDVSAASLGETIWAAYPTSSGVSVCPLRLTDGSSPQINTPILLPHSQGVEPTLSRIGPRLVVLLWRGPHVPVSVCFITMIEGQSPVVGPETVLGFRSAAAVGAVSAGEDAIIVGRIACTDEANQGRTEVIRFTASEPKGPLQEKGRELLDGVYSTHRMTLLWRPEAGFNEGRVYHLSGGVTRKDKPWAEQYITLQTAYPEGGGWQWRKYYQDDYASVSAPGACWFQNNIVYALRLYSPDPSRNDVISLGFYGTGASPETQGDFDDISHLSNFGLSHSLPTVSQ